MLKHHPNGGSLCLPIGEVIGDKIEWDVVLFKYSDNGNQIKQEIERNQKQIESMIEIANKQVSQIRSKRYKFHHIMP